MKGKILSGALLLLMFGCGGARTGGSSAFSATSDRTAPPRPMSPVRDLDIDWLPGHWETGCTVDPLWAKVNIRQSDKPHLRNRVNLTPSGRFQIESTIYAHDECEPGDEVQSMTVIGNYSSYPRQGLELTAGEMRVVFHTNEAARAASRFEGTGMCGISSWKGGEMREVSGTVCLGNGRHTLEILKLTQQKLTVRRHFLVNSNWHWRDEVLTRSLGGNADF